MKSKAHISGHPLHPMLIAFPIAFLTGCFLADLAWWLGGWPSLATTGAYLSIAAVVSGLVAAVPGVIDYFGVIPPGSSAKRRATYHMVVNVLALTACAAGWAFRDRTTLEPGLLTVLLEAAAVLLVGVGGSLGGTLVYRNQIAVDHRYAHAGKWKEQDVAATPGTPVAVAGTDELKVGQMKLLRVNGRRIVLARTDTGYAAFDDFCTHRGGPLSDGVLICGTVQCPWHGSQFDASAGAVKAGPADRAIGTYRVEEADGQVRLTVPG
jgi:nitrite reductase/ring-hydroxylating ferredoxin subunit/uncharacterized membrane protein